MRKFEIGHEFLKHGRKSVTVVAVLLSGCVARATYHWYVPQADWGTPGRQAGSSGPTPTINLVRSEFPPFTVQIYMQTEPHRKRGGSHPSDSPTLVMLMFKSGGFHVDSERWKQAQMTPVRMRATSNRVEAHLDDGKKLVYEVPELQGELTFVGTRTDHKIEVELKGLQPQSFTLLVPSFMVNGEPLKTGPIKYRYEQTRQWVH